jgi:hypothetical protein
MTRVCGMCVEWKSGFIIFGRADLFFSLRFISFYTINTLERERGVSRAQTALPPFFLENSRPIKTNP